MASDFTTKNQQLRDERLCGVKGHKHGESTKQRIFFYIPSTLLYAESSTAHSERCREVLTLAPPSHHPQPLLSASSVCHVGGDDHRTGEDLVRGEEAAQMPKHCLCSSVLQPFHVSHIFPPRSHTKGKEIQARVCFTLSHSKGNIH